jgi:dolichol-phosphate mannosyltransferase
VTGTWLVLPTYNEAENIDALVRAALGALRETGAPHHVLIVDDDSPDGTGTIADALAVEFEAVEVLHRNIKEGLGRAYVAGFKRALEGGAELVMEMDADFSHDPSDIPVLVAAAADADLVLGSRYVEGGGVRNWGRLRRAVSRGGSLYARVVLGLRVRDLTGGFKCFRREVLDALDLSSVHADGYGFQIELTYRAVHAGFRVKEIPIVFSERERGRSKMTARIALEAIWKVPLLRVRRTADRHRPPEG